MNKQQREEIRRKHAERLRSCRGDYDRIMLEIEREGRFGKTEFPTHADPVRTSSGVRFGW